MGTLSDTIPVDENWIPKEIEGAHYQIDNSKQPHEANFLKLDCSKAANRLKWHPQWRLEQTLEQIIQWHRAWLQGEEMQTHCLREIKEYMN